MTDDAYLLDGKTVAILRDVAKKSSGLVVRASTPDRRRRNNKSSSSIATTPFQMSLTVVNDIQYAQVTSGVVFTNSQNPVPVGLVNLSSYNIDETAYIYLKIATSWFNGDDLKNVPSLTILTGENDTNFYGNNSIFPSTDEDNLYYQIGTVLIKDNEEGGKIYSIGSQIANENITIESLNLNGFSLVKFLKGKATDTEADTDYSLTMNKGNAKLPDNSNVEIPSTSKTVSTSSKEYVDLKISATINVDGFFGSFLAVSEFSSTANEDTTTDVYFNIGTLDSGTITQNQIGDFVSDGRVW